MYASFPSPTWMSLTKLPPNREPYMESLVSDIPAEDGKSLTFFLQCSVEVQKRGVYFEGVHATKRLVSRHSLMVLPHHQILYIIFFYKLPAGT